MRKRHATENENTHDNCTLEISQNTSNIDKDLLEKLLPADGLIIEQLPQLIDENNKNEEQNEQSMNQYSKLIENEFVSQTFVPSLPPRQNEDTRSFTS
ncbi:20762_t:CDS:2 [Gigaspora margarita]|uniref:20762_t:CDS:1 n=1 Tax=Gigaspora margarita TaxID=4874 RepID=A0ABN7V0C6_GIGMA|nr:20762_t:CDS:2 [Gigaspora margarita]